MTNNFTPQQLQELEMLYGLTRRPDVVRVRDGMIAKGDMLWFRNPLGAEAVNSGDDATWRQVSVYPDEYQIKRPFVSLTYID